MKNLYIHAGLNKCGSSFLQNLLFANRSLLRERGFSYEKHEPGRGNATSVAQALRTSQSRKLRALFADFHSQASRHGVDNVVLSSELLYHLLVRDGNCNKLADAARESGFNNIEVIIFFRDPVSHAISCYCHRSGTRSLQEFGAWISTDYEFPREIRLFLDMRQELHGVNLTATPYLHKGLGARLSKWLRIPDLPQSIESRDNYSVTPSEAVLLNWLFENSPHRSRRLRSKLKSLDVSSKSADSGLLSHWRSVAEHFLAGMKDDLIELQSILDTPSGWPQPAILEEIPPPSGIQLSKSQYQSLYMSILGEALSLTKIIHLLRDFLSRR